MKNKFCRIRFLIFILSLLTSNLVYSCSCSGGYVDMPIKEMGLGVEESVIKKIDAKIIFEGILLSVQKDSTRSIRDYALHYEVTDVYKGECVDTITVWTNNTSGGCGFRARLGTYSIVIAAFNKEDNSLYTYRADCWGGASKYLEPKRFDILRGFLIVIAYAINGEYSFSQRRRYWPIMENLDNYTDCIKFTIDSNKLSKNWIVYDRNENIIEEGNYLRGKRIGTWYIKSKNNSKDSALKEIGF